MTCRALVRPLLELGLLARMRLYGPIRKSGSKCVDLLELVREARWVEERSEIEACGRRDEGGETVSRPGMSAADRRY